MNDTIDISKPVQEICDLVGIEHDDTSLINIRIDPAEVRVTVLKRNGDGKFYVDPATHEAAQETLTFRVWT